MTVEQAPTTSSSITWEVLGRWVLGIIGAGVIATASVVIDLQNRVTRIETSHFTQSEGNDLRLTILKEIQEVKDAISDLPVDSRVQKNQDALHAIELHLARRDGYVSPRENDH